MTRVEGTIYADDGEGVPFTIDNEGYRVNASKKNRAWAKNIVRGMTLDIPEASVPFHLIGIPYDPAEEAAWQEAMRLMNGKPIHSVEQAMIRLKWKIVPVLRVPRDEAHGIAQDLLNDVAASHLAQFRGAYDVEDMEYSHGNATTSDILLDLADYAKTHEVSENERLDILIEQMLISMTSDLRDRVIAFVTAYPDVAEVATTVPEADRLREQITALEDAMVTGTQEQIFTELNKFSHLSGRFHMVAFNRMADIKTGRGHEA